MNKLLATAIEAHGGLDRWNTFDRLTVELMTGGALWQLKQQPDILKRASFAIHTKTEQVTISPFPKPGMRSVFTPDLLVIEREDGPTVEMREDPEKAFAGHRPETPWDELHAAYFASEAVWTYLTSPFLYTYPGFVTEEIEPWYENDEEWRRLKVTFPDYIRSHTKTQVTHFGPDGLMRRHDYKVDLLGEGSGVNYIKGYHDVQGIMMPSRRRVYTHNAEMRMIPEPLLVSLDFGAMLFE